MSIDGASAVFYSKTFPSILLESFSSEALPSDGTTLGTLGMITLLYKRALIPWQDAQMLLLSVGRVILHDPV